MRFKRKHEKKPSFQMTSMIDIVFLLLVFFMSISTFHQLESEKDINLPIADKSKSQDEAPQNLIINIRKDGTIIINQNTYLPNQIVAILSNLPQEHAKQAVIIRADKGVRHGKVSEVLSACAAAGVWDISFAAYQEKPKR
jgi:biopolymer transport protein ExbD